MVGPSPVQVQRSGVELAENGVVARGWQKSDRADWRAYRPFGRMYTVRRTLGRVSKTNGEKSDALPFTARDSTSRGAR